MGSDAVVFGIDVSKDRLDVAIADTLYRREFCLQVHGRRDRESVAAALKGIYRAVDTDAGESALSAFEENFWGRKYPAIGQSWRRAWGEVIPFYAFPGEGRSTSLSGETCYPVVARVTAWQRVGIEDAIPTTLPSESFLLCGTRALLRVAAPLRSAHKPLVG
jgi:hypothetical protein